MGVKNSKFSYMYRDADNYKVFNTVVFSGEFSPRDAQNVMKNLFDEEFFIPGDVDLENLQGRFEDMDPDLDHPWHEVVCGDGGSPFSLTDEAPTDSRSVRVFAREFALTVWNSDRASIEMGL